MGSPVVASIVASFRRTLLASLAFALVLLCAAAAHAGEAWSEDSVRTPEIGMTFMTTRTATSASDAVGMPGGRLGVQVRLSSRWSFEWNVGGFGGRAAHGWLTGGWSMSFPGEVHFCATPHSPAQLYFLFGYELGSWFLRGGPDVPQGAQPGFLYSGPSAGLGLDARVDRGWTLRLDARVFGLIRGFPDDMLKDSPRLADDTRFLTGFTLAAGIVRSFGRI